MHFLENDVLYFVPNFIELRFYGFSWKKPSFGSGNGLAPNRRQTMFWTNVPVYQHILASPTIIVLIMPLHWRHNERDGVSNHRRLDYLLNRLFRGRKHQRKHQSFVSLAFVRGIHRWPVNSPHKGPVTRKMFPFDDVIIIAPTTLWFCSHSNSHTPGDTITCLPARKQVYHGLIWHMYVSGRSRPCLKIISVICLYPFMIGNIIHQIHNW